MVINPFLSFCQLTSSGSISGGNVIVPLAQWRNVGRGQVLKLVHMYNELIAPRKRFIAHLQRIWRN